jgi:hypothetical protein
VRRKQLPLHPLTRTHSLPCLESRRRRRHIVPRALKDRELSSPRALKSRELSSPTALKSRELSQPKTLLKTVTKIVMKTAMKAKITTAQ